jgi:hypothetical protein
MISYSKRTVDLFSFREKERDRMIILLLRICNVYVRPDKIFTFRKKEICLYDTHFVVWYRNYCLSCFCF